MASLVPLLMAQIGGGSESEAVMIVATIIGAFAPTILFFWFIQVRLWFTAPASGAHVRLLTVGATTGTRVTPKTSVEPQIS